MKTEKIFNKRNSFDKAITIMSLSGQIDGQEIIRQALLLKKAGFDGIVFHANAGLKTQYMGKEWLETIKTVSKALYENGIKTFIADEDRRPGGICGSLSSMNSKYRAKSLTFKVVSRKDFSFDSLSPSVVGVYAINLVEEDGLDKLSYYYKINDESGFKTNDDVMVVSIKENEGSLSYNGGYYLDTLNSKAVENFFKHTHEVYKREMGEYFGKEIAGFFEIEPIRGAMFSPMFSFDGWERSCPYTYDTLQEFSTRWHYDLVARLPELFFLRSGEDFSIVAAHYCEVVSNQFLNAYIIPYYEWCKNNNLLLLASFAGEETLEAQTMLTGSVMNCYRYCDIPGIDVPYDTEKYWGMMKQVSSVKNQFNKPSCFTLSYGATGWANTFNTLKTLGDLPSFLGINTRINDKASHTLYGVAKRDYPSSITTQSAFIDEYSYVENYFSRLAKLNEETTENEHVLVLHPLLSAWGMQVSGSNPKINPSYKKLEDKFEKTYSFLVRNSIEFDYGDEIIMSKTAYLIGKGAKARIVVGEKSYKQVIIHGLESIRSSTVNILEEFAKNGGEVYFVGALPTRVNGYKIDFEKAPAIKNFKRVEKLDASFVSLLSCQAVVSLKENGKDKNVIFKTRNAQDGKFMLFALNLSKDKQVDTDFTINGQYKVTRISVREDVEQNIKVIHEQGQTKFSYCFAEGEELVCRLALTEDNYKTRDADKFAEVEFSTELDYKMSEPNVMVLDSAQFLINGKNKGEMDVLQIDATLRKEYELFARDTIQPYFKKHVLNLSTDTGYCDLELRFKFEVIDKPNKLQLVLEEPEKYIIFVNGRRLPITKAGDWVDSCFERVALPTTYLVEGENEICLTTKYSDELQIEPIYLIGDFGVKISKKNDGEVNQIIALPKKLTLGDITKQGLPYYGGKIYYFLSLEKGYYKISFPGHKTFAYAKLKSADKDKIVAFAPYTVEKKVGKAERDYTRCDSVKTADVYEMREIEGVQIEVGLTRRNTFGPLHYKFKKGEYATPYEFEPDKENYSKRKVLQKSGLIELRIEKLVK